MNKDTLGVDIGGIIIAESGKDSEAFSRKETYLEMPAVEGAFTGLRRLVDERFGDEVYLISKGGRNTTIRTRAWFYHHDFHGKTGVKDDQVYFCKERRDKVELCQRFGVTHFIDDLLEVLGYLYDAGIKNLYLLNPRPDEVKQHEKYLRHVHPLATWEDVVGMILRS